MAYYSDIEEIENRIAQLPKGSIGKKTINGKTYFYQRWNEKGKLVEKYIPKDNLESMRAAIEEREHLQMVKENMKQDSLVSEVPPLEFRLNVITNRQLRDFAKGIENFRMRECFDDLQNYLHEKTEKVLILYGLRRTGKTTLIRQAINSFSPEETIKAAFIQITPNDTMADLNHDLKELLRSGYRYVFIDEITFMEDFIEGSALLSDIFVTIGMRIVLSGTDSLGFLFAREEQLYDRCIFIHTTYIPYREFEQVLGISGIDEYIRYGGTMSLGGVHYNKTSTFSTLKSTDEYVDSSIANNIQHSLEHYQFQGHFRALQELYEKHELTGAINRVVEDMNHRFTIETLTKAFKSNDLALSARNLRNDRTNPISILDEIDVAGITKRLVNLLEIKDREEQTVVIQQIHADEIKEYMDLLDLTADIDVLDTKGGRYKRTVIAQPGLRYSQVQALIESLIQDSVFSDLSVETKAYVLERIRNEVRGRMMEDIVLLETKKTNPDKQVFKLQFAVGEYDMVVFDPASITCDIFEIKHSTEADPNQTRHLLNPTKNSETEFRFGKIRSRNVIYRGDNRTISDVNYLNVEEYLSRKFTDQLIR